MTSKLVHLFSFIKPGLMVYLMAVSLLLAILLPSTAYAADCGGRTLLGFPPWYDGLTDGECNIMSPKDYSGGTTGFVWRIILNIVEMLLLAVGYVAAGFIIFGGYKYIYSAGSPDGMVAARKTIMNACIGLVLSLVAFGLVNGIANGIMGGGIQ